MDGLLLQSLLNKLRQAGQVLAAGQALRTAAVGGAAAGPLSHPGWHAQQPPSPHQLHPQQQQQQQPPASQQQMLQHHGHHPLLLQQQPLLQPSHHPLHQQRRPGLQQQARAYAAASARLAAPVALAGGAPGGPLHGLPQLPHPHTHQLGWPAHPSPAHWSHLRGAAPYASSAAAAAQLAAAPPPPGREEDKQLRVGCLVEFRRGGAFILGRVIGQHGGAWRIEDVSGAVFSVRPPDVTYVLPGAEYSAADLGSVAAAAGAAAGDPAGLLDLAWQMSEATSLYSVPEMADFLFGNRTAAACAAAHRLLRDDRLFFKQAGRTPPIYTPRTPTQVAQLQQAARAVAAAEAEWQRLEAAVGAARAAPRAQKPCREAWAAGAHGTDIAKLESFALVSADAGLPGLGPGLAGGHSRAFAILERLGMPPSPHAAADLLQAVGYWPPHVQVGLLAAGITETFAPELEAMARELAAAPPPDPDAATRRDLTHHRVYTIDDISTTEIDDGLSLERLPDGRTRVWVHIADPTRWVAPDSPLDAEARQRTKSLYLPTAMVPMFPKALAEGPFSLREGVACCALSVGVVVGADGCISVEDITVAPSTVVPTQRLTYHLADEMLAECSEEEEPDLHALLEIARLRRERRLASGATEIDMPECNVEVERADTDEPEVSITVEDQWASPSRQMVAEMMILAGEVAGLLGGALGLPLPYRGQADPVLPMPEELDALPPGPCRAVALRMRMTRSLTQADAPLRHAGLGLDAYVQVTSPIRRYGDLLAHWQLKAVLRGAEPPLGAPALGALCNAVGEAGQRVGRLERDVTNYWVAEYFRQASVHCPSPVWGATFLCWLKQDAGLARVLLDHMGLECVVRVNRPLVPGDPVFVRCCQVDVRQGLYRMDEVPPTADVINYRPR